MNQLRLVWREPSKKPILTLLVKFDRQAFLQYIELSHLLRQLTALRYLVTVWIVFCPIKDAYHMNSMISQTCNIK